MEKRISMLPHKPHATSQPSRFSHTQFIPVLRPVLRLVGAVFRSTRTPVGRLTAPGAGGCVRANVVEYVHGGDNAESMHSFRRGHIQAAHATVGPTQVTMQRATAGISSGGTFQKHADRGRHLR